MKIVEGFGEVRSKQAERQCTVCKHPKRREIEAALMKSPPDREVSAEFGVSIAAIGRHRRHSRTISTDIAGRKAELQARLGKAKDDRDYAALSRELRALEEHEIRLQQESASEKPLRDQPGFALLLTHLLTTIGECERCREAVLQAAYPGDTRSE